jgi:hypothetical protein
VARRTRARKSRRTTRRFGRTWPSARARRRWWGRLRRLPPVLQFTLGALALVAVALLVNVTYQVIRKPTELFFPVSDRLNKTPAETWREYGPIFIQHSTATISPEFLAALAQAEASGNPVVRTYWRFSLRRPEPFDVYKPASSAVGMYQLTDGTFEQARRYCVHDHVVVEDGPWNKPRTCWFNWLYFRVVPSHAAEMTSAFLDRQVAGILARHGASGASAARRQDVATLAHLCGPGIAEGYVRRGFRIAAGQRCGDHDPRSYLLRVRSLSAEFRRLNTMGRATVNK